MGIFSKIKAKVAGAIEKSAVSHMNEEEKAKYEAERAAGKQEVSAAKTLKYTKTETQDLEGLLMKLGVLDERKIWIGGFLKLRSSTNAKFANMFSGHKNLRFLAVNDNKFYMVNFKDDVIMTNKEFTKENVASISKKPTFAVTLFDKTAMHLDVTQNKQKVDELITLLKVKYFFYLHRIIINNYHSWNTLVNILFRHNLLQMN